MYLLTVLAKVALGFVFGVAGIAKLFAGFSASRKSMMEFGVPRWFIPIVAYCLPFMELAASLLLLTPGWGRAGSVAALALLVAFSATITANLALGRKPTCNCFGQLHSSPIGRATLVRNAILAIVALWLAWQLPHHRDGNLMGDLSTFRVSEIAGTITAVLGFAAITVEGFFILHVLRQNGRLMLRIEALEEAKRGAGAAVPSRPAQLPKGLPVGQQAISFELPTLRGQLASLDSFLAQGKAALLVFTDPNCGPCNALLPEISAWQRDYEKDISIVLISNGSERVNQAKADEFGIANILLEKKRQVSEKYQAFGTPSAVVVRKNGTVGSFVASGADAIRRLIFHRAWDEAGYAAFLGVNKMTIPGIAPKRTLHLGSVAPPFELSDLDGNSVRNIDFVGHETMLLFWNPSCGFCKKMLPQLRDWERTTATGLTRLLLVSIGSRELNREMGLSSTVVLDQDFLVGRLYGSNGTPSAILINSEGEIASTLVIGQAEAMKLLTKVELAPAKLDAPLVGREATA